MSPTPALQISTRRFSWPEVILLAFVTVQILDGVMTYVGVHQIGWVEGNPLVAWYAMTLGPAVAFTVVKLFAVACGSLLYFKARHGTVALLTIFYLAFAVAPWAHVITVYGDIR